MESVLELILQADIVVQFIMALLAGASIWTWAVIFNRLSLFRTAAGTDTAFEKNFWASDNLVHLQSDLAKQQSLVSPMANVFLVAMNEWSNAPKSPDMQSSDGLKASFLSRVERAMDREIQIQLDRLEQHVGGLANVGSSAVFVGLLGTVWGIMNSFSSIAASGNTSLTVVAPGIAEALFATALGLVAAIPASITFNIFTNRVNKASLRLESFSSEFALIIRRQIEQA